jgi:cytochrome c-type biogenesis protein CcmH/NrfG
MRQSEDAIRRLEQSLHEFPSRLKSSVALARIMLDGNALNGAEEVLKKAGHRAGIVDSPIGARTALYRSSAR